MGRKPVRRFTPRLSDFRPNGVQGGGQPALDTLCALEQLFFPIMKLEARQSHFCRTISKSEAGRGLIYLRIEFLGRHSRGRISPMHPIRPRLRLSFFSATAEATLVQRLTPKHQSPSMAQYESRDKADRNKPAGLDHSERC